MASEKEVVKTDVDRLLALIEQKKLISIEETSKILKIDAATIESWARFLEEENMLKITYQLTKPFLEYISGEHKSQTTKIDTTEEKSFETDKTAEPEEKTFNSIKDMITEAEEKVKSGELNEAKRLYERIILARETLPKDFLETKYNIDNSLVVLNSLILKQLEAQNAQLFTDLITKINEQITRIKTSIKKKDATEANANYIILKDLITQIPLDFSEQKKTIENNTLGYYRDIVKLEKEYSEQKIRQANMHVDFLFIEVDKALSQNNVIEAFKRYDQIKAVYDSLPKGHILEKIGLQERMLSKFKEIIIKKKSIEETTANYKKEEIKTLIETAKTQIKLKKIDDAFSTYASIKNLQEELKEHELSEINQGVSELLKILLTESKKLSDAMVKSGANDIKKLILYGQGQLKAKQYDLAIGSYNLVTEKYDSLPKGYVEIKHDLRTSIIDFNKMIIENRDAIMQNELDLIQKEKYNQLVKMIVLCLLNIEKNENHLARENYKEVMMLYEQMPLFFLKKKTVIKSMVFDLYQRLNITILPKTNLRNAIEERKALLAKREEIINRLNDLMGFAKNNDFKKAMELYENRKYDSSIVILRRIYESNPAFKDIKEWIKKAETAKQNMDKHELKETIIKNKFIEVQELLKNNCFDEAIKLLNEILALEPNNFDAQKQIEHILKDKKIIEQKNGTKNTS